ncbi:MAG: GNAT family N-acetyltransferase [Acinetobacter sp.]|uniref:GNAT family N-acetyltransferase n=1 Tax=Acinetobacter sp. TaxID=472 RepID=UPI00258AF11E|nr:GNAT family N-acetyltransferase [Acinetobacter sp.]MCE1270809.1 GNAT family N-acetyltransferase [Acinetobacter sp.]
MSLNIRNANIDDVAQLVELINLAYRAQSDRSWTTEKAFVDGTRITNEQLSGDLSRSNFKLFVGENEQGLLVACIGLSLDHNSVEIGTFAIDPTIQNLGYGREILNYVEAYIAQNYSSVRRLIMYVLDVRIELMAYYQRRGYQITGHTEPYPVNANVGQPLVPIQLVEMKKVIL